MARRENMEPVVVMVGIQGRQHYMTMNNRLRQAVGASKLMDDAVRGFAERFPAADPGRAAQTYYPNRRGGVGLEAAKKDKEGADYNVRLNDGSGAGIDQQLYRRVLKEGVYRFPLELEHLGHRHNDRHIAVVHCD